MRSALVALRRRLAMNPGLGESIQQRGTTSVRITPVGGRLPYLVAYYYDEADETAPVWLAMLRHERQDRERFDPALFE